MPTKKKPTPKPKKTNMPINKVGIFSKIWKFTKDNPALVFLLVIIVAGLMYGSIYLFERWQFSSAEKKLDTVASAIVAELGEPISIEKSKTCSYQSTVFEDQRGLPSCGISYILKYADNINELGIDSALNKIITINFGSYNESKYATPSKTLDAVITYDFRYRLMNCNAVVKVVGTESISSEIDKLDSRNRVYLYCGKHKTINKPYPVN